MTRSQKKSFARNLCLELILLTCAAQSADSSSVIPVTDDTPTTNDIQLAARKEMLALSSDDFETRIAAVKRLQEMDLSLLPWLKRFQCSIECKDLDAESKKRLSEVINSLEQRNHRAQLLYGNPVNLNIKNATAQEILTMLAKQSGDENIESSLLFSETKRDFSYIGNYWGAVDKVFASFGLKGESKLDEKALFSPFEKSYSPPYLRFANCGIACLQLLRVSFETEANGDFISFLFLPKFQKTFIGKNLTLNDLCATLDNGVKFNLAVASDNNDRFNDNKNMPIVVSAPFIAKNRDGQTCMLNGVLKYDLIEFKNVSVNMGEKKSETVAFENFTIMVNYTNSLLTVKIIGDNKYNKNNIEQGNIACFDANGEKIPFESNSCSSESGGIEGSFVECSGPIKENPAKVIVQAPITYPKLELPFQISNIRLPLSK